MPHINYKKRSKYLLQCAMFLFATGLLLFIAVGTFPSAYAASENHLAQSNPNLGGTGSGAIPNLGGTVSGPGKTNREVYLVNPLKFGSFPEFFKALIDIIIIFAIPIIVLMIIYAGFLYVMARGSEEQVTKATRALTYAVLGGLLILGAELFLTVIQGTVNQLTL